MLAEGATAVSGGAVTPGLATVDVSGAVGAGTVTGGVVLAEGTSAAVDGAVFAGTLGTATLGVCGTVVGAAPLTGWATVADVDDADLETAAAEGWPVGA